MQKMILSIKPLSPSHLFLTNKRYGRRLRRIKALYGRQNDSFTEFDKMFEEMNRVQDQQFQRIYEDMDQLRKQQQQQQKKDSLKLKRDRSNIHVERSENRTATSYQYYESVSITSGPGVWNVQAAQMTNSPFGGFLTVLMLMAASLYAFFTYRFNRNYELSTFKKDKRVELSLVWPALLTSQEFRKKFWKVVYPPEERTPRNEE